MNIPFVCSRCQLRILQGCKSRKGPHVVSAARFVSLSPTSSKPDSETSDKLNGDGITTNGKAKIKQSDIAPLESHLDRDTYLEELFKATVRTGKKLPRHDQSAASDQERPFQISPNHKLWLARQRIEDQYEPLDHLGFNLNDPDISIADTWRMLQDYIQKHKAVPFVKRRVGLQQQHAFEQFLKKVLQSWGRGNNGSSSDGTPSPAESVAALIIVGGMRPDFWSWTFEFLLTHISTRTGNNIGRLEIDSPVELMEMEVHLLSELLDVWSIFLNNHNPDRLQSNLNDQGCHGIDWSGIPSSETLIKVRGRTVKYFGNRFYQVIGDIAQIPQKQVVAAAALATFTLINPLHDYGRSVQTPIQGLGQPFSRFIAQLLPYSLLDLSKSNLATVGFSSDFINHIKKGWERMLRQATVVSALTEVSAQANDTNRSNESMNKVDLITALFQKRLSRALERSDYHAIEALWSEANEWFSRNGYRSDRGLGSGDNAEAFLETPGGAEGPTHKTVLPHTLYNRFANIFMSMRKSDRAIDVWNAMIASGQRPSLASWHALLDGCQEARDIKALEFLWNKMIASGFSPDAFCWTARISALTNYKPALGIKALHNMRNDWLQAVRTGGRYKTENLTPKALLKIGDVNNVIKPTIETINAALSGLARHRKEALSSQILEFGESLGIKPDVFTLNTMLRPIVRQGRAAEALRLIHHMGEKDVSPDVVTYTIILDGLFRSDILRQSSPTEQEGAVTDLLAEMESSGIEANVLSYSTLIDGLLRHHNNVTAAQAVMDHMTSRSIKPTPHIYTILLTHYFTQEPPNLLALESLWIRIRREKGMVDLVFYDRMIEGYARVGDIDKMMKFLRLMPRTGKVPGWGALHDVLRTLVEAEEWHIIRELLEDVEHRTGILKLGVRGNMGKDRFFELVQWLKDRKELEVPAKSTKDLM